MNFQDWEILKGLREKFLTSIEMALVFGEKKNKALLFTSDDRVFGVGENVDGCLGLDSIVAFHGLPTEIPTLAKKGVKELYCGGDGKTEIFLVAHLYSGEIYWWGRVPYKIRTLCVPEHISFNSTIRVKTIVCSSSHCAILSEDGKVFTWGQNRFGQLGHNCCSRYTTAHSDPSTVSGTDTPSRVKGIIEDRTVIDISCGYDFSVVFLDNGRVVTWGNNDFGQLGLNGQGSFSASPVEVSSFRVYYDDIIEKIAAGRFHVLALSDTGTLYGWGNNSYSQLGILRSHRAGCPDVLKVNNLRFVAIEASYRHDISVAQCKSGLIYIWGETINGDLTEPTKTQCESMDHVFETYAKPITMIRPMRRRKNTSRELIESETVQQTSVKETLEKEFNSPDTSDLTIVVDGREIYVHQSILKMRSEYFNIMITRWLERNEQHSTIPINEKSYAAIEAYLKFLYTDKLEVDLHLAVELLQLADEYGDDKVRFLCEEVIKRKMTVDAVADLFAFTRKFVKCKNLNEFCLDFSLRHAAKVIASAGFKKWDPDTLMVFVNEYVKIKGNCR